MIELEHLSLDLGSFSVDSLNLRVERGEFFMVVGPSGAGKTLMLEAIAGLRPLSGGKVRIDGQDVTGLPPEKRNIALVYQDYALFPHMSVERNVRWGLRFCGKPDEERVNGLIDLFRLRPLLGRSPETLSGGEQQRAALARALAVKPSVLLLDEPLSALDPSFREELRDYLAEINREGMTIVMVTHDFGEVLSLGNRVAVISGGKLQQWGNARTVFREPANRNVAEFVGMKNLFECEVQGETAHLSNGVSFLLRGNYSPERRLIGIRPEDVVLSSTPPQSLANLFYGRVVSLVSRGMAFEVVLHSKGGVRITASVLSSALVSGNIRVGEECWMSFSPESIHVFRQYIQKTEVQAI